MSVDAFAMARGATGRVDVKQTAERVWEPKFVAEILSGRDPRVPPNVTTSAAGVTVAQFLDRYFTNYAQAEGLRTTATIKGRLKAIKDTLGDLPVTALEKPAEVLRFKAAYRKGHEVATVNRALGTLRAAINWGRFQDPPYLVARSKRAVARARCCASRTGMSIGSGIRSPFPASIRRTTAWESLLLLANGHDTKRAKPGARVDRGNCVRSTCTGTICATKAPAGCWPTAWISGPSS